MIVQEVYINEDKYPELLKEIKEPPNPLYYVGNLELIHRRCVAVVGSRTANEYGRNIARKLGARLAQCGVTVISGMARGIDTCAHLGALEEGAGAPGNTAAVLGCGADICYPASNRRLRDELGRRGLLLSEYPPGTAPARYRFPRRNRIISGLAEATVVVQAPNSSGALITAELAAEQGRTVYAVPGPINSAYHLGSNKLLRDGAVPLVVLEDLISEMGFEICESGYDEKNLGRDEKKVVELLRGHGEMTLDQVCGALGKPASFVSGILTILEIKGVICTSMGKIFIAK